MRIEATWILFSALSLACYMTLGKINSLLFFFSYIKQEEINFTVDFDCFQIFWWVIRKRNKSVYHWPHEYYWICNNISSSLSVGDTGRTPVSTFFIAFAHTQDPRPLMLCSRYFSQIRLRSDEVTEHASIPLCSWNWNFILGNDLCGLVFTLEK